MKFEAPEHTKGPLAGYAVVGCWRRTARDPQWRGDVGREEYEYRHHFQPALRDFEGALWDNVSPARALEDALYEWRDWGVPDHIEVDAVYASQLSPSAGSQDDPFLGLEGTSHDGYDPSGKSKQRGRVSDA